ncbi:TetR/AcrR family transcriptional regulator [Nitriliruptor alkaliphilus]|uniref:TetR/AcrR family transcriptional regulator n=1 Tax=Nitriliruptor alkaliphilus TaxID=427918 RepID=UPI0006960F62|nr:TetR/AcrR family transcriptional regulator [Nitriliruptor alkaliphilus]
MADAAATPTSQDDELSPRVVELIRSTYRVMAHRGSHRLSLQDIAEEAGVSKGLLLYHFKTKDNLLLATMRWALQRTADRIRRGTADAEDARAALRSLVEAVFVDPELNRDFNLFYLDLIEHAVRVAVYSELPELLRTVINDLYAEVISRGVDESEFHVDDVDAAARAMRAQIEGTFLQWMQEDDWRGSHSRYRDECYGSLVRLLGA